MQTMNHRALHQKLMTYCRVTNIKQFKTNKQKTSTTISPNVGGMTLVVQRQDIK